MNPATIIHNSLLTSVVKQRSKRGGCKYPFPQRLFDLLEYINVTRESGLSHIISWYPNGKSFQVHDREAFEEQIQPKMFNQSKYASFNRQLNLWGFERIPNHHACGPRSYFHPLFQRHDRGLCCTMHRSKGPGITSASPSMSTTTVVSGGGGESQFCSTTTTTRSDQPSPFFLLEIRLRRTEQLLDQQEGQGQQDTNDEDSPSNTDDKEFHDLISFLSAKDENILKYLLES